MTLLRHRGFASFILALGLVAAVSARPVSGGDETPSPTKQWAQAVWSAAKAGDEQALGQRLHTLPAEAVALDAATRFRDSYELHLANDTKAKAKREEARDKAAAEMREHLAAGDLSKALRSAVTVQTLSDSMESAFADPDINKIIAWATERIPKVEADLDWLLAQELLFYIRTLYEDTSKVEEYKKYKDALEAVNRRVSLLLQYAPHQLHELRARRAERLGDKPIGEYKPSEAADWHSHVKGIKPEMLRGALYTAAKEHIEAGGWKPLLRGGLEELRLLATTASLDETFPKLGDPTLVQQWVAHLDEELNMVATAADADLDHRTLSRMLDDLMAVNLRTTEIDKEVIYREFGDGALYELDEFSEIIWPDKLPRFKQATEGAFVGVGILIRHNDAQEIMVVKPLEGTPAYFGGVKPNDRIMEVDGEPTVGWSLNDAVDRITGAPATEVKLGLQREGVEGLTPITLKRDVIKLRSVLGWWKRNLREDGAPEWDWYIDPVSRIAYVKLTQFTEDTYNDLVEAWGEITANGKPAGLILDLRYNPGGLLTSAVDVSNLFVKEGMIVSGEDKDGHPAWRPQQANPNKAQMANLPVVVLINQGSASASEIVSGCLQAHGAAIIVGERSFGKGSVQTVHATASNARLKLTTQYYRLPPAPGREKGRLVHKRIGAMEWGVDPDITVKMTPQQATESLELAQKADVIPQDENGKLLPDSPDRPDISRLLTEGIDPQLDTALLILQAYSLGNVDQNTRHALNNR